MKLLAKLIVEEDGQDLVEYGLLIGAITSVSIAAAIAIGTHMGSVWSAASTEVNTIPTS